MTMMTKLTGGAMGSGTFAPFCHFFSWKFGRLD